MLLAVLAHAVAAVLAPFLVRTAGPRGFLLLALVPAATAVGAVRAGAPRAETVAWIPGYGVALAFRLDALALLMTVLVTGIGALILVYCARYFPPGEPGLPGFAGVFLAFAGAMLGLVLADDLVLLYVFWELTTVFSYLLIGHHPERRQNRRAAMTALMVTAFGGLALLGGAVLLGQAAGTYRISALVAQPPHGGPVPVALALLLTGALAKSALVPLHFWLPGAMAAPTPVSAYLHAAAMVKAGVYLVARLTPAFADTPLWRPVVFGFGLATMLVGAWRALRQYDLKLLLAFGTVSQLGLLVVLAGAGTRAAAQAALVMLAAHAVFKAALFLAVGVIDRATGTRDLRELSGLRTAMPVTCAATVTAAASMAGVPPLAGYLGKEAAFAAFRGEPAVLAGLVAGSALTFAYSARFVWGAFRTDPERGPVPVRGPDALFAAPVVLLAAVSVLGGFAAGPLGAAVAGYADRYPPGPQDEPLGLWHGLTLPLGLSALVIAAGAALFHWREAVARLQAAVHPPVDAERSYRLLMREVDRAAEQATRFTQRGSLPIYLRIILLVLFALPGGALLMALPGPGTARPWDVPAETVVAVLIAAGAVATALLGERLAAAVCAGVAGIGTAAMFVLHGAPDLGLTQFLTETMTLVVFVLILRRLPVRFGKRQVPATRQVNAVLAVVGGLVVAGMTYVAVNARAQPAISAAYPAAAAAAGGTNLVNVALVDLRAWDTMGESTVLLVASAGLTGLIFLRRPVRRPRLPRGLRRPVPVRAAPGQVWTLPEVAPPGRRAPHGRVWLRDNVILPPERRSIIFEVVARLAFHPMLLLSLYLLCSGHGAPGGGFAGGLVAGLALAVRYLAGGRYELDAALPVRPGVVQGVGLTLLTGVGLGGLLLSGQVLRAGHLSWEVPLLGEVHFTTALLFDLGVYLVVVGVVRDLLRGMGGELDRQAETDVRERT